MTATAERTFWTTAQVQVKDLRNGDVAQVDGAWHYVYNVHEDDEGIKAEYGEAFAKAREWASQLNEAQRLVEFADDLNANYEEMPRLWRKYVEYHLVTIQVPITPESA